MDDFIIRALFAGVGLAAVCGILGCFVVSKRMAYFSDSLAHSTLLGVAIGLQLGTPLVPATLFTCLVFACLLLWIQRQHLLATDTILGILAHTTLALGILAISFSNQQNFDLHGFLFGNILTVSNSDLYWLYGSALLVLIILAYYWQPLLLSVISSDLAAAEGNSPARLHAVFTVLLTITVAVSIHIIGVLLIAALLIIPAAAARLLAKSPEIMALLSAAIGISSVLAGIWLSLHYDAPAGPVIVATAAAMFVLLSLLSKRR